MVTFWSGLPIPQRGESEIRKGPTSPGSEQPKIKQGIHEDSNKCFIIGFLLPPKVRLVKAMVFPGVMYGCETWTITKADC